MAGQSTRRGVRNYAPAPFLIRRRVRTLPRPPPRAPEHRRLRARTAAGPNAGSLFDEPPAEAALDAELAVRDLMVERRRHLDDPVVLGVQRDGAANAAVPTDRVGLVLARFVPLAGGAHVELAPADQRPGRAHADAVAAVHAGRIGEVDVGLARNLRVESPSGDRDGIGVLGLVATRLDAAVTEDAARHVTHVEVVVEPGWCGYGGRDRNGTEAPGIGAGALELGHELRAAGDVGAARQELQHQAARPLHARRLGTYDHAVLRGTGT